MVFQENTSYRDPKPYHMVFIDSSAIDEIRSDPKLELFFETEVMVWRSPSLEQEIAHKNTPVSTKLPFKGLKWYMYDSPLDSKGQKIKDGILNIMKGNANNNRHQNDALHIFYAAENDGYLIAVDKRIIKKRDEITKYLFEHNFKGAMHHPDRFIFTPEEFYEIWPS